MFEKFTEKAIKVVMLAQEESRRLGHNYLGTEQLLIGLIREETGIAAKLLKSKGLNLKETRSEVEKIIGRGSGYVGIELPFTARIKKVFELALQESKNLDSKFIGTEHLLLGILEEGDNVAIAVLRNLGVIPDQMRIEIMDAAGAKLQNKFEFEKDKILSHCDNIVIQVNDVVKYIERLKRAVNDLCNRSDISKKEALEFREELKNKLMQVEKEVKSYAFVQDCDFGMELLKLEVWVNSLDQ